MYIGEILINKYKILSRLNNKGYRQKCLALNLDDNIQVVVETLHDDMLSNHDAIADIRYSVELSQKLTHRLFPKCLDTFIHENRIYLIWEYHDLETISMAYKNKFFEIKSDKEILQLIVKIGHGLDFARQQGILHGNLNGNNIKINPLMEPKLTDFSLNKSFETTDPDQYSLLSSNNLYAGEFIESYQLNPSSDFYALGMLCKFLLLKPVRYQNKTLFSLNSGNKKFDQSIVQIVDGLCSTNLNTRNESISRLLDDSFLDIHKTPAHGVELVKISPYAKWKIKKNSKKYRDG